MTSRSSRMLVVVALLGWSTCAAPASPSEIEPICIRAVVVGPEANPISGANVQLVTLDEDGAPSGEPEVRLADPEGRVEFCDVGFGRYLVHAQITGFVDTRIGPIPVTEENYRYEEGFRLLVVLNPTVIVCPVI